jgi:hypothetical protein
MIFDNVDDITQQQLLLLQQQTNEQTEKDDIWQIKFYYLLLT